MIAYLNSKEIASRLGVSHKFAKKLIKKAKPPEKKDKDDNYTFEYCAIVDFIRRQA